MLRRATALKRICDRQRVQNAMNIRKMRSSKEELIIYVRMLIK